MLWEQLVRSCQDYSAEGIRKASCVPPSGHIEVTQLFVTIFIDREAGR